MLVRDRIAAWSSPADGPDEPPHPTLPRRLKADTSPVRTQLLQRLAASRSFALGDRAGVLSAAQRRSGRAFRLDLRQRVVVQVLVSRHQGRGAARGGALAQHVAYLLREGAGQDGGRADLFDRDDDAVSGAPTSSWAQDRHHFRVMISPEYGDRIADLRGYVREVMGRVADDLGEPNLEWRAVCHFDTDQPHAHVLVRGRREDGRDLVIPRDYVAYGIRARAQEVAQELLGDLSRHDAERRVWRETEANRFTALDRRLVASADASGEVEDPAGGQGAWPALLRGRLLHLERLNLAERVGRRYRLAPDLEPRLRSLQMRQDIIRTLNQRRFTFRQDVQALVEGQVRGRVVERGQHDELGAERYLIVRDAHGAEHYARLRSAAADPRVGQEIVLTVTSRGAELGEAGAIQRGRGD